MAIEESRILRLPEVLRLCGMSKSLLYQMIGEGEFPAPVRIGQRSVGWRYGDVLSWLESRPTAE